jgi:hypothetical protein
VRLPPIPISQTFTVLNEAELMCKLADREPRVGAPVAEEPVPVL